MTHEVIQECWVALFMKKCIIHTNPHIILYILIWIPGSRHFKNTYELLNLRALKISSLCKKHTFQCMGKIFYVEFQREPLKFHTNYLTHTLKDAHFI